MMNVDNVLADKARKKREKEAKLSQMKMKREQMRPMILFPGVKDDPLPYERFYI